MASPDLPMLYLHFIVIYLKCGQFDIDVNGIKQAAEYLNSSKVKYDDDVINNSNRKIFVNNLTFLLVACKVKKIVQVRGRS